MLDLIFVAATIVFFLIAMAYVRGCPHTSPAAAEFQIPRAARERSLSEEDLRRIVSANTEGKQLEFLGEPRVNVLLLNLALDEHTPEPTAS